MIQTYHHTDDPLERHRMNTRNKLLLEFFRSNGFTEIAILADAVSPVIIYENKQRLACYVTGYTLVLLDNLNDKNTIGSLTINTSKILNAEGLLKDFIKTSKHDKVYKVALKLAPFLFLCGYNFKDREEKLGKEPVFSVLEPRIYLTSEKAQAIVDAFPHYDLYIK